ncbi:hypothetical protein AB1Y20_010623 [Prymnesium parvum]|uniref:3-hydroxyisobutyryl-CoA hydrolase n=1 Tax=Prymnesium parvum TaxID=97485 RepID=A0AB34IRA8_PRYPA
MSRTNVLATAANAAAVGHMLRHRLSGSRVSMPDIASLSASLNEASRRFHISSALVACNARGSALPQLRSSAEGAAEHYSSLSALLRRMGEAELPTIVTINGHVTGAAAGVAAHAAACVVTERACMSLPGPAFGFVPESFASYQLARLPRGLGAYLALTGATLSAREMVELGLATHATESKSLRRVNDILNEQSTRHLGRTLRNVEEVCIEPRFYPYSDTDALFHIDSIEECFGQPTLPEILRALEAGTTPWHEQALGVLRASSPLAIHLTFNSIQRAAAAECWTTVLKMEADLTVKAMGSADFAAGAEALEYHKLQLDREVMPSVDLDATAEDDAEAKAKVAMDTHVLHLSELEADKYGDVGAWEHDAIEAVPSGTIGSYFP